jgi:hypothetical protein
MLAAYNHAMATFQPVFMALLYVLAFYPILYVSAFLHEVGHAVLGRWNGWQVTSLGMGVGHPVAVWSWRGSRVFLGLTRPFQGLCFAHHTKSPSRRQYALYCAGGILVQTLLAMAAIIFCWAVSWGRGIWFEIALANGLCVLMCAIPFRMRVGKFVLASDGAQIRDVLRGQVETRPVETMGAIQALRGLWRDIGDFAGLYYHLYMAAYALVELGNPGRAAQLCKEADSLPIESLPAQRAFGALVRGIVAQASHEYEACAAALVEADAAYRETGDDAGTMLVTVVHSELLLAQGAAAEAWARLQGLADQLENDERPTLVVSWLSALFEVRAALPASDDDQVLLTRYQRLCRRFPSWSTYSVLQKYLACFYACRNQWTEADRAYEVVLARLRSVHQALSNDDDQAQFLKYHGELLAGIKACWRQVGKEAAAAELDSSWPSHSENQRRRVAEQRRRDRRVRQLGVAFLLLNLIIGTVAFGFSNRIGAAREGGTALLIVSCAAAWILIIDVILRFCGRPSTLAAWLVLLVAVLPWLFLLVALIADGLLRISLA